MKPICIGIVGSAPGWSMLLAREGVPHRSAASADELEECSAVVAGDDASPSSVEDLRAYLRRGGGLLCSSGLYARISGVEAKPHLFRYLLPEAGAPLASAGFVDLFARGSITANANTLRNEAGVNSAYAGEGGGGYVVVLPVDPSRLIVDARQAVKSFYAQRRRLPYERVPAVSKEGVQQLVARGLELLHHMRGVIYAHLWYYPRDSRSVVIVRVDTDRGDERSVGDLHALSVKMHMPFTWFLDVRSQEPLFRLYASMKEQEIGLHCYEHRRYADHASAKQDLQRGRSLLENAGFFVEGCALPYGQWSDGLGDVLAGMGFLYSSEFSCDADNLPGYPLVAGRQSPVLQVPVHPVSIGSLRRQGFGEEEMIDYFEAVIAWKVNRRLPLAFYHHPGNGHGRVVEHLLSAARERVIQSFTMSAFARWWKRRVADDCSFRANGTDLIVGAKQKMEAVELHLTRADGREAFHAAEGTVHLGSLRWESVPDPIPLPGDITRMRRFNPWIPLQRAEDAMRRLLG